jgi:hypothetical protein
MDDCPSPGPFRDHRGRFGPGNPGRPPGSRNRMSRRIALSLLRHFTEHEAEILDRLSRGHLRDYMRLLGRMLPDDPEAEAEAAEAETAPDAPPSNGPVVYGETTAPLTAAGVRKSRDAW